MSFSKTISVLALFLMSITCCQCADVYDCNELVKHPDNNDLFYIHRDRQENKQLTFNNGLYSRNSRRNNSFIDLSCLRGHTYTKVDLNGQSLISFKSKSKRQEQDRVILEMIQKRRKEEFAVGVEIKLRNEFYILDLSDNLLKSLDMLRFDTLYFLQHLDLSRNQIFDVEKVEKNTFKDLHSLIRLSLSGNEIESVRRVNLNGLGSLGELVFDNNWINSLQEVSI